MYGILKEWIYMVFPLICGKETTHFIDASLAIIIFNYEQWTLDYAFRLYFPLIWCFSLSFFSPSANPFLTSFKFLKFSTESVKYSKVNQLM